MTGIDQGQRVLQASGDGIPRPGDIIAGKYQVERVLGKGGMGVVVAAWHTALRQRVAVKFLLPAAIALPEASGRFLREAQSASAIKSEHVARVLDVGTLESGSPYIIMEYLTGTDLSELLKSRGPLPITDAVDCVLQACEAIAEAHSLGIVHRDLKPSNLFLTSRADGSPLVKVLDFGLSKMPVSSASEGAESSLTATNTVVGSPHYMSPEQMRSLKRVDARTDIWSLGVILYQLLTGRRPFEGESIPAVFGAIAADQPPSIRSYRKEIPAALDKAILHCLEKDLPRRTQTVAELARALRPFGSESAGTSLQRITKVLADIKAEPTISARSVTAPAVGDSTTAAGMWRETQPSSRQHLIVAFAASVVAFVIVASIGFLLVLRKPSTGVQSREVTMPISGAESAPAAAGPSASTVREGLAATVSTVPTAVAGSVDAGADASLVGGNATAQATVTPVPLPPSAGLVSTSTPSPVAPTSNTSAARKPTVKSPKKTFLDIY